MKYDFINFTIKILSAMSTTNECWFNISGTVNPYVVNPISFYNYSIFIYVSEYIYIYISISIFIYLYISISVFIVNYISIVVNYKQFLVTEHFDPYI